MTEATLFEDGPDSPSVKVMIPYDRGVGPHFVRYGGKIYELGIELPDQDNYYYATTLEVYDAETQQTTPLGAIDYRDLLVNYMATVMQAEGADFLPAFFADDEGNAELQRLSEEAAVIYETYIAKLSAARTQGEPEI